jgi:hypothetical protein
MASKPAAKLLLDQSGFSNVVAARTWEENLALLLVGKPLERLERDRLERDGPPAASCFDVFDLAVGVGAKDVDDATRKSKSRRSSPKTSAGRRPVAAQEPTIGPYTARAVRRALRSLATTRTDACRRLDEAGWELRAWLGCRRVGPRQPRGSALAGELGLLRSDVLPESSAARRRSAQA